MTSFIFYGKPPTSTKSWQHTTVSSLKILLVHQITSMIASKWITDWNSDVQSAKDLSVITIQQFYVNLVKTLVTNVTISRLWVFVLIIHWSCLEMYFDWRAFFVTRCCWYFATFWHLVILLFANNIKIVDASTSLSSIFAISTKSYDTRVKISQVIFFFITFQILHLEIQQEGIFLVFLVVCLLSEKERSATWALIRGCLFLPNLHVSKKFHVPAIFTMTSSKIWRRHREYICIMRTQLYWRYPVQSFMPVAVLKQKLR